ncbi:MAG: hypothetical protein PPP58_12455 [Natronomonas sp.]
MTEPTRPFAESIVEAVAGEHGTSTEELWELVERHQSRMAELPGTDNLVYEWRRGLPYDPVLFRTSEAHYVAVNDVWPEFASDLGLTETETRALAAVHDRQLRAAAADREVSVEPLEEAVAVVVTRR